jgi:transposase InsO family protein
MDLTLPGIEEDLKRNRKDERVRAKLFALRKLCLGATQKSVALELGIAERTIARWLACYRKSGAIGLKRQRIPGRPQSKWLRGWQAKKVLLLRRKFQWGPEVLAVHMKKLFGITVSQGQIYKLLQRKNLLRKTRRRKVNKHTKKVRVWEPGKHTQMDVRHVDNKDGGIKRYIYNFVDHASKWSFKYVYDSYGPSETHDFMMRLLRDCPFAIQRLQTDNGIEFTNRYLSDNCEHVLERICKQYSIRLVFIPPGEKELQGLVESHHRVDKDEFFARIGKRSVAETNELLKEYLSFRNRRRGFKWNRWLSPMEYLKYYEMRYPNPMPLPAKYLRLVADLNQEQIQVAA